MQVLSFVITFWGLLLGSTFQLVIMVGSGYPSSCIFVAGRLPKSLYMEEDPYEEFAREHGEVPGRTREICSGKAVRRKRTAYRVEEGEDPDHLHTPRTWEPNADSSDDGVELVEYPELRRSLSDLSSVQLVPQAVLYQPVRIVGLVPKACGSSDPYGRGKAELCRRLQLRSLRLVHLLLRRLFLRRSLFLLHLPHHDCE